MKKKLIVTAVILAGVILLISSILIGNHLLTELINYTNTVCRGQTFTSVEAAIQGKEQEARQNVDTDLDYCPPYEVLHTFNIEKNVAVLYSYCHWYDGEPSSDYAICILRQNGDGTLSFESGFADFCLEEPTGQENYYYFTNIETEQGERSVSFLYLPKDTDKVLYVDGIKTTRVPVKVCDREFYICYAISDRDTFLSNLFTPISRRHTITIETETAPSTLAPSSTPTNKPTATPQPEPTDDTFVRVRDYIPSVKVALPYATRENFTGKQIYAFTDAWLRYGTVKKLMQVADELEQQGLYLKIWDAFRPTAAQFKLWEIYPDPTYVANPNYGFSSHSRGNTVDITLVDSQGREVTMPTGFDDFSKLADRDYSDCPKEAADNARLLENVMVKYDFKPYVGEWWHFSDNQSYEVETDFVPT